MSVPRHLRRATMLGDMVAPDAPAATRQLQL